MVTRDKSKRQILLINLSRSSSFADDAKQNVVIFKTSFWFDIIEFFVSFSKSSPKISRSVTWQTSKIKTTKNMEISICGFWDP